MNVIDESGKILTRKEQKIIVARRKRKGICRICFAISMFCTQMEGCPEALRPDVILKEHRKIAFFTGGPLPSIMGSSGRA